jgi:hypothetical protein
MECQYCHNTLINKHTLKTHQRTAVYCLQQQGKKNTQFICSYCKKSYSTRQHLNEHHTNCRKANENTIKKKYSSQLIQQKELIDKYELQIKDLQDKLENIALKAISKPSTTQTQINNYISQLQPITDEHLTNQAQFLTIEHVKKGAEGYAEYALEYPLRDRLLCVDYSRRKVKFKDKDGNLITDPEMTTLATKFFDSIWDKNRQLISEYGKQLFESDNIDTEQVDKLIEIGDSIRRSSGGEKTDLQHDWVKAVCSKTIKE